MGIEASTFDWLWASLHKFSSQWIFVASVSVWDDIFLCVCVWYLPMPVCCCVRCCSVILSGHSTLGHTTIVQGLTLCCCVKCCSVILSGHGTLGHTTIVQGLTFCCCAFFSFSFFTSRHPVSMLTEQPHQKCIRCWFLYQMLVPRLNLKFTHNLSPKFLMASKSPEMF